VRASVFSTVLGDLNQAVFAGIWYPALGDWLKLMAGAEYSVMRDSVHNDGRFDGWTCFAGVRLYF